MPVKKIANVEIHNAEEYEKIDVLYDTVVSTGVKLANKSRAIERIPAYLACHNIMCCRFSGILYVKKEDIEVFKTFVKNFKKDNYYSKDEAAKVLGLTRPNIAYYDRTLLTPYKYGGGLYYRKEEINYFKNLKNETKTAIELKDMFGYASVTPICNAVNILKSRGNKNVDLIPFEMHMFGFTYLIKGYEDVVEYLQSKKDIKEMDSYNDKFIYKVNNIKTLDCKGILTLEDLKLFAKEKHDRLKETSSFSESSYHCHVRLYDFFNKRLKKPLHKYNEEEFKKLCAELRASKDICGYDEIELGYFVQYCKAKYRDSKLPNTKSKQVIKKKADKENREEDYTTEQWIAFAHMVYKSTEEQDKIKLAVKTKEIAMTWAYIAFHFVASWRKNDICNIPFPDLELLGFNHGKMFLEYIKNEGIFTEKMGEIICFDILNKVSGFNEVAFKNEQPLKFVISKSWLRPIGLLLALCEAHRQTPKYSTENVEQLIGVNCCRFSNCHKLFGEEYVNIMGKRNFSNLAATRIMLKFYEKKGLETNIALSQLLPAAARSHKPKFKGGASPTTADFYLANAYNNKDNDINNITFAMVEREFMSFAGYQLLFALNPEFKHERLDKQTSMIKSLSLTPTQVHSMSMTVIKRQSEIDEFMKDLISLPKSEIKGIIMIMMNGKAPSKHHCANCLLRAALYNKKDRIFDGGITDICVMKQSSTCFGCDYLIGEKYFLIEIVAEIKKIIKCFKNSTYDRDKKRYGEFLKVLHNIVVEATYILGRDKVGTYITEEISNIFTLVLEESISLKEMGVKNTND